MDAVIHIFYGVDDDVYELHTRDLKSRPVNRICEQTVSGERTGVARFVTTKQQILAQNICKPVYFLPLSLIQFFFCIYKNWKHVKVTFFTVIHIFFTFFFHGEVPAYCQKKNSL